MMLRITEYRHTFVELDGVNTYIVHPFCSLLCLSFHLHCDVWFDICHCIVTLQDVSIIIPFMPTFFSDCAKNESTKAFSALLV